MRFAHRFSQIAKVARVFALGSLVLLVTCRVLVSDRDTNSLALAFTFFCWTSWLTARWFEFRCAMSTAGK